MDTTQNTQPGYSNTTRQIGLAATVILFWIAVYYGATGNEDGKRIGILLNALAASATFAFFGRTIRNTPAGRKAALMVFAYLVLATMAINVLAELLKPLF